MYVPSLQAGGPSCGLCRVGLADSSNHVDNDLNAIDEFVQLGLCKGAHGKNPTFSKVLTCSFSAGKMLNLTLR